ncbi:MAG: glycosyltransferase family 4 protein [Alphaproteobacteria bacterium]|nr:glycosyltransferase family 4 protein [Alphaproteobacteria bacterium]
MLLVIWPELPPAYGGMQVHGVALCRHLAATGRELVVLSNEVRGVSTEELAEHDQDLGVSPLRLLQRDDLEASGRVIQQLVRALRPRVVLTSQVAFTPFCEDTPVISRSAGNDLLRPWIGPADVSNKALKKLPFEERRARLAANRAWIQQAAARCDAVFCNSAWTRDRLAHLGIPRTPVIQGGVDTALFTPRDRGPLRSLLRWPADRFISLIAARQVIKKGIDVALQAMAQLDPNHHQLRIVGDGPLHDDLRGLAAELELGDRVVFQPKEPHAALASLLAAADAALMPSRDAYDPRRGAMDYETMGRFACEAAACGLPTVASRVAGLQEVVRDGLTGLLVPPDDPGALAEALETLRADRALRTTLGEQARAHAVAALDFAHVNRATLALVDAVLAERAA